jgi:mannose-6-phosphate isomerase-like protein (cupin superfamily)
VAASEGTDLVWRSMDTEHGDGWAVGTIDGLGSGPGFRKIRSALGVTAFGINAIVLPPSYATSPHHHETQEEVYIVLTGEIELTLGGERRTLGPGGLARVDAGTVRSLRNLSESAEATYVCVGGAGGYVGRDGVSDA